MLREIGDLVNDQRKVYYNSGGNAIANSPSHGKSKGKAIAFSQKKSNSFGNQDQSNNLDTSSDTPTEVEPYNLPSNGSYSAQHVHRPRVVPPPQPARNGPPNPPPSYSTSSNVSVTSGNSVMAMLDMSSQLSLQDMSFVIETLQRQKMQLLQAQQEQQQQQQIHPSPHPFSHYQHLPPAGTRGTTSMPPPRHLDGLESEDDSDCEASQEVRQLCHDGTGAAAVSPFLRVPPSTVPTASNSAAQQAARSLCGNPSGGSATHPAAAGQGGGRAGTSSYRCTTASSQGSTCTTPCTNPSRTTPVQNFGPEHCPVVNRTPPRLPLAESAMASASSVALVQPKVARGTSNNSLGTVGSSHSGNNGNNGNGSSSNGNRKIRDLLDDSCSVNSNNSSLSAFTARSQGGTSVTVPGTVAVPVSASTHHKPM